MSAGSSGAQYLRGALAVAFGQAASAVAGIAALWLLARILPKEAFGGYAFAMNLVTFVAAVASLGLDRALMLRVAPAPPARGLLRGSGLALRALALAALAACALAAALAAAAPALVAAGALPEAQFWLPALALAALPIALSQMMQAWFVANHRAAEAVALPGLADLARAGLLGLVLLAGLGAGGVAVAVILAAALPALALGLRARGPRRRAPRRLGRRDLGRGLVYLVQRLSGQALLQFDIVLVGLLATGAITADYAVAARLAQFADFGRLALRPSFLPRIRRFIHLGDQAGAAREYRRARSGSLLIALAAAAGFALLGPWLLRLIGGFGDAYPPLLVLAAGFLVRNGTGMHDDWLAMTGEVAGSTAIRLGGLALFIGLGLFLVPALGSLGAAIAVLVAMAAMAAASVLWLRARTGFLAVTPRPLALTLGGVLVLLFGAAGGLPPALAGGMLLVLLGLAAAGDPWLRGLALGALHKRNGPRR